MEWIILLCSVFIFVFSGMWLAIALGITGWIVYYFLANGAQSMIGSAAWNGVQMYSLVAVSCFILMGQIVLRSGISKKVYDCVSPIMERVPGGLLHTNIALCALFASVFGTSAATAAVVGSSAFPELKSRHYDYKLTLGSVAAGGTLGILIPPSAAFIIYGVLTGVSIGALFAAGILPGIALACMFSVYIVIRALLNPQIAPREGDRLAFVESLKILLGIWPIILLITVVLVPIFAGWCTATESSGIGVVGAIILGKTYGMLSKKSILESVQRHYSNVCNAAIRCFGGYDPSEFCWTYRSPATADNADKGATCFKVCFGFCNRPYVSLSWMFVRRHFVHGYDLAFCIPHHEGVGIWWHLVWSADGHPYRNWATHTSGRTQSVHHPKYCRKRNHVRNRLKWNLSVLRNDASPLRINYDFSGNLHFHSKFIRIRDSVGCCLGNTLKVWPKASRRTII